MNSHAISNLIKSADDMLIAPILGAFEIVPTQVLQRVIRAEITFRLMSPFETFECVSPVLQKHLAGTHLTKPPAGVFVVAERTAYIRTITPMTVIHELGHAFDLALGAAAYYSDTSNPVMAAFDRAVQFVTLYASTRIDEYFAECFRAYFGVNDTSCRWTPVSRATVKHIDPVMCALIADLISNCAGT